MPLTDFAERLQSRLVVRRVVHAHMFGAWWAAAVAAPDGLLLSRANTML